MNDEDASIESQGSLLSGHHVPQIDQDQLEDYTDQVAVEKTPAGFYGEDGYYYYYVYEEDNGVNDDTATADTATADMADEGYGEPPNEVDSTAGPNEDTQPAAQLELSQGIEPEVEQLYETQAFSEQHAAETADKVVSDVMPQNLYKRTRSQGFVSFLAPPWAQEAEQFLSKVRDWVDIETELKTQDASEKIEAQVSPDEASAALRGARVVDIVKAKACLDYLKHGDLKERWRRPPEDSPDGALVARLRIPTIEELQSKLRYEDTTVPSQTRAPISLGKEWQRIQAEVQQSIALQTQRAKRASVEQRRRQTQVDISGQRRVSNLYFLVPPQ
eukprot:Blabericola_migrator_1__1039@NODE_1264_length_4945_cov_61_847683_g854_i0_p2_GENE_NODE_1264_length_4945_cov_61_847683_g854_i0NODE_1264_length_4945_cov_61_847683_g854_i0_p2_ORF_typecomplete_len331_score64_68TOBE_3/PF12857_7/0_077_NODE_1264_length_4945_cov_61_847683_g854_i011652157